MFTRESPLGKYLLHVEGGGGAAPAENCCLCFGESTTGSLNIEAQCETTKKVVLNSKHFTQSLVSFWDACGTLVE